MTNDFKKVHEGIFCFLLVSIQCTTVFCLEDAKQIINLQSTEPRAKLGEPCSHKICEENLFCEGDFPICQCPPGFKIYNNECKPSSGKYEPCSKNEDCCGHLLCINGLCRKPGPNSEFITLAKICLGITVTMIIIAVFSSIIKCLFRYDNSRVFRRQSNTSSYSTILHNSMCQIRRTMGPCVTHAPINYDLRDEKPPSYEECVQSARGPPPLEPPPYIISTNTVASTTETNLVVHSANLPAQSQQNLTTPLNVQSLSLDINSNAIGTQSSGNRGPDTAK